MDRLDKGLADWLVVQDGLMEGEIGGVMGQLSYE